MVLVQKEVKAVYLGTHKVWPVATERPDIDQYTPAQTWTSPLSNSHGLCVNPEWTILYIGSTSYIGQYSISQWDISSLTQVYTMSWNTRGMDITKDGKNLYSTRDGSPYVRRLNLSTAWDLSTNTQTTNTSGDNGFVWCAVNDDATKLYRWNATWTTNVIYYTTMTDGSISSLSWTQTSLSTVTINWHTSRYIYDLKFSPDGRKLFVNQHYDNETADAWAIVQYNLTTPRDVTTATATGKMLVPNIWYSRFGFDFDENGNLYIIRVGGTQLYKYSVQ